MPADPCFLSRCSGARPTLETLAWSHCVPKQTHMASVTVSSLNCTWCRWYALMCVVQSVKARAQQVTVSSCQRTQLVVMSTWTTQLVVVLTFSAGVVRLERTQQVAYSINVLKRPQKCMYIPLIHLFICMSVICRHRPGAATQEETSREIQ